MTDQPSPDRERRIPLAELRQQDLDLLYNDLDRYDDAIGELNETNINMARELAALRAVSRGYCPACGRGDAAPSVEDWERERQRADSAEEFSRRALAQRQEMAEERYAWQERGDRAEAAVQRVRSAAALHRKQLLSTAELYAVIEAATDPPTPGPAAAEPTVTVHVAPDLNPDAEEALGALIDVAKRQMATELGDNASDTPALEALGYHAMGLGYSLESAEAALARVRDLRDDLRGITGARWIADALDNILDGQPADLNQREPS